MMKKYLILIFFVILLCACFNKQSIKSTDCITFSFTPTDETLELNLDIDGKFKIDWGDEKTDSIKLDGKELTHKYGSNKIYKVILYSKNITQLYISGQNISDFKMGKCQKLISLDINYISSLNSLDLSSCPKLEFLDCKNNNLTVLDLSKNIELSYLDCSVNKITSLIIPKNTKLENLACSKNLISTQDFDKIIENLPNVDTYTSNLNIRNNPGSFKCNKSAAILKGWKF